MISFHRLQHAARMSAMPFLYPSPIRKALLSDLAKSSKSSPLDSPPLVVPSTSSLPLDASAPQTAAAPPAAPKIEKQRPKIRSTKQALTIVRNSLATPSSLTPPQTPTAVLRLNSLLRGPTPQLIRVGVRNKGCAGLSYHLEYVDKPGRFDEVVEQDGVRVVIDSKALFSIIGSEMDWKEDALRCVLFAHHAYLSSIQSAPSLCSTTPTSWMHVDVENPSLSPRLLYTIAS